MIINYPISVTVNNFKSNKSWQMFSADPLYHASKNDLARLVKICNEPLIYHWLFQDRLSGKKYSLNDARDYITWAQKGWQEQTHFVFLIKDTQNVIQAAVDIKSSNLQKSEIGYWASCQKPGIMTNAVNMLCKVAKRSGFEKLFGDAEAANHPSQRVLTRAGFTYDTTAKEDGKSYLRFTKLLTN